MMKKNIKQILLPLICVGTMGLASCSDYLDINKDPNQLTDATSDMLFPTTEMALAASYGNQFNYLGAYMTEIYGQNNGSSNYLEFSSLKVTSESMDRSWLQFYQKVLNNLAVILHQETKPGTRLAATVMKAYTYQILTDAYGECPYTEANVLGNTSPKYDDGADIYDGILKELDEALAAASPTDEVCTNLLFGTSTASEWIKFANALKLRILMRESGVKDVKAELAELINANHFPTADVVFDDCWGKAASSYSPMFADSKVISTDIVANIAFSGTMNSFADPRWKFNFADKGSGFMGAVSGTNLTGYTLTGNFSMPNFRFDMPVFLMTVAEVEFFKAEYYARINVDMAKAKACYEAAIDASFNTCGQGSDATKFATVTYAWDASRSVAQIAEQKWLHLGCIFNGFEAWCEVRRMGYPVFHDSNYPSSYTNTLVAEAVAAHNVPMGYTPFTLYVPYKIYSTEVNAGETLKRWPYPIMSTEYNTNAPSLKNGKIPVFWNK